MPHDLVRPPKARRGDRVAVLSPSFAAAGGLSGVHEQMIEITEPGESEDFGVDWADPRPGLLR